MINALYNSGVPLNIHDYHEKKEGLALCDHRLRFKCYINVFSLGYIQIQVYAVSK